MVNKILSRWKEVLIITAVVRLLLLILPITIHPQINNLFSPWVQWDGPHYLDLAKNWYQVSGQESYWIVFYPLYPILIKIFNFFVNDFATASILVSILFSFSASVLLFELTLLDFNKKSALLAVWFLNIFPTSYFLQASYTESLFLTTSLVTVYLFRKKLFFYSGVSGMLSTMARINGLLLIPLLASEVRDLKKGFITLLITPLGFLFYLSINYLLFHHPFYFTNPLYANWYKRFDWPWVGIKNLFGSIPPYQDALFYAYISEATVTLFIILIGIYTFVKVRRSYGIYTLLNLLLFTSTSFVMSIPRYALILFPIFIALAQIKSKTVIAIISTVFIILLIYFSFLYTQGQWAF